MNIHEFQAKDLLRHYGIVCPRGFVANSPVEAEFAVRYLKRQRGAEKPPQAFVVKAQVQAGGRGKAGGVKLVRSPEEAAAVTKELIGKTLVTPQTGAQGKVVHRVYVEEGSDIAQEFYLALVFDRERAGVSVIFSLAGGMDIEEVAEHSPEKLISVFCDPTVGLQDYVLRELRFRSGLEDKISEKLLDLVRRLYPMFLSLDMSLLEINPLVWTKDQQLIPLDAKMGFDDNALYRHPEVEVLRDFSEEDAREIEASKFGLNYIGLSGNIGCLVNGAGLAMATMDIVKHSGGEPANFLDVGGGATEEMVTQAFSIILRDPKVKGIFVNIFGGIMRCDVIASGIIAAAKKLTLKVPLVVRLEGTNVKEGQDLLNSSGLAITSVKDMAEGAAAIVAAAKKAA